MLDDRRPVGETCAPGLTSFAKATVRQSFSDVEPRPPSRHALPHCALEHMREARDAFVDLRRLRIREVQPHEPVAGRIGEEITSRHEQHVLLDRLEHQIVRVDVLGTRDPQEHPALWMRPRDAPAQVPAQRRVHPGEALAVGLPDHLDVRAAVELGQVAVHDQLIEARRVQVGALLGQRQLAKDLFLRDRPAHSQARRDGLRHGAQVDDLIAIVQRLDRRDLLAGVPEACRTDRPRRSAGRAPPRSHTAAGAVPPTA